MTRRPTDVIAMRGMKDADLAQDRSDPPPPRQRRLMMSVDFGCGLPLPGPRYQDDFYAWTQYQAAVVRQMPVTDIGFDREHVAEEIDALGRSERDAVRRQIRLIIAHILLLTHSPTELSRSEWRDTIDDARQIVSDKMTASLRRETEDILARLYGDGRNRAELTLRAKGAHKAAAELPFSCLYTLDQLLLEDWYPNALEHSHDS
jgi:Domain of unknown function DUF29